MTVSVVDGQPKHTQIPVIKQRNTSNASFQSLIITCLNTIGFQDFANEFLIYCDFLELPPISVNFCYSPGAGNYQILVKLFLWIQYWVAQSKIYFRTVSLHEASKSVSKIYDSDEDNVFLILMKTTVKPWTFTAKVLFEKQELVRGDSSVMNISRVLWRGCQLHQHNEIRDTLCTRRKVSAWAKVQSEPKPNRMK